MRSVSARRTECQYQCVSVMCMLYVAMHAEQERHYKNCAPIRLKQLNG